MTPKNNEYLEFALELVKKAEKEILQRFDDPQIETKADGTEVTDADREAERLMRELIEERYPDHGILGEEFGEKAPERGSPYLWVLDPIDGTASFTMGLPNFGTLVALVEEKEPIMGVIHMPAIGDTVYAFRGEGCWFKKKNEKPFQVKVAEEVDFNFAVISATGVHSSDIHCKENETPYQLSHVIQQSGKVSFWGDCIQHALVATGRVHVAIDPVMKPWDIAALVPCIEEAGGKVTSIRGKRKNILDAGSLVSSCGGKLHAEVIELLKPEKERT